MNIGLISSFSLYDLDLYILTFVHFVIPVRDYIEPYMVLMPMSSPSKLSINILEKRYLNHM